MIAINFKKNKKVSNKFILLQLFKIFVYKRNISLWVRNVIFLIVRMNFSMQLFFALKYLEIFFNYVKSKNFSC